MRGTRSSLLRRRLVAAAALGHELVKLRLVLGVAQSVEKRQELALLVFQAPQRLLAVIVERAIAAGGRLPWPPPPLSMPLHAVHPPLHAVHVPLPARLPVLYPASHATTPDQIAEDDKAQRPEHNEADDHQRDPGGLADVVH